MIVMGESIHQIWVNEVLFDLVGSGSSDSPNQFSQSKLKISSSMMNVTKEEKFKIDIDVSHYLSFLSRKNGVSD